MSQEDETGEQDLAAETLDPALPQAALERIRQAVKGNGINPEKIELADIEGGTLIFSARTRLDLKPRLSEKTVAGKQKGPQEVANKAALASAVEQEKQKIQADEAVIRQIRQTVLDRDDKGFGLQGQTVKLPFLKKEYVWHEGCKTCKAKGQVPCQRCHGKGFEPCPQCHGQGLSHCPQCRGAQTIQGPQARRIQCPTCHGKGKSMCTLCQQRGKVQCRVCKTRGAMPCPHCQGHAWNSHVAVLEMEAQAHFDYEREGIPPETAREIESLGPKLAGHAQIDVMEPRQSPAASTAAEEQAATPPPPGEDSVPQDIEIAYRVKLPQAALEFSLSGKMLKATLFGYQGRLTGLPDLLDGLIKPGLRKLDNAAAARGSVAQQIREAARYRIIRQGLIAAARLPPGKAAAQLAKANPLGVSHATVKTIILKADQAIRNISRKPRQNAMLTGCAAAAALFGGYFLTPLAGTLRAMLPHDAARMALDGGILLCGLLLASLVIQAAAGKAIAAALKGIVPPGQEKTIVPKTGKKGLWAYAIIAALYLACLELTVHLPVGTPEWYNNIRGL